jgi:hypothetical protein
MESTPHLQLSAPDARCLDRRAWSAVIVLLGLSGVGGGSHHAAQVSTVVLENEHVRVTRNDSRCASPSDRCRDRILVALGDVQLTTSAASPGGENGRRIHGAVGPVQKLRRGDIAAVSAHQSYHLSSAGDFLEVTIKANRPPVKSPPVVIPPDKNSILYNGDDFFVFEEKLEPGDTRARHSHRERVVIVINRTRLQQWPEGAPELFRDQIPDDVRFNPPVVHVVKTVGEAPLRNVVIEFKR